MTLEACFMSFLENRGKGRRGKDGNRYYDRFIERSVSFEIKTSTLDNPTTHALVRVL